MHHEKSCGRPQCDLWENVPANHRRFFFIKRKITIASWHRNGYRIKSHLRGIHWSRMDSCHKWSVMPSFEGLFAVSPTNCWTNSRMAGDLRRKDAYMISLQCWSLQSLIWKWCAKSVPVSCQSSATLSTQVLYECFLNKTWPLLEDVSMYLNCISFVHVEMSQLQTFHMKTLLPSCPIC